MRFGSSLRFPSLSASVNELNSDHTFLSSNVRAARVVYADIDPVVIAHSRAILAGNASAAVIHGDVRDPEGVLGDPVTRALLDFSQPVGLLLVAVLHFLGDADDPARSVARLRDALPAGSYLVLAHATNESRPELTEAAEKVYQRGVPSRGRTRSRAEIMAFFAGFDLVEPGLVYLPQWRPDAPGDVPADAGKYWFLAGVARKP